MTAFVYKGEITDSRIFERHKRFPNARKESSPIGEFWVIPESEIRGYKNQGRGRPMNPASKRSKAHKAENN